MMYNVAVERRTIEGALVDEPVALGPIQYAPEEFQIVVDGLRP